MNINILNESNIVLKKLQKYQLLAGFIDALPIPKPYTGSGQVKLIILGQDPTVKNESSRKKIKKVLNLDNETGALYKYLMSICDALKLNLIENVYATNVIKNFFTDPPTVILKNTGIDVLKESAPMWLPLLQKEIDQFPDIPIISLGEPILNVLVQNSSFEMKDYWGYTRNWQEGFLNGFSNINFKNSVINRTIFPVIHQPSKNKPFYKCVFPLYMNYIKFSFKTGL